MTLVCNENWDFTFDNHNTLHVLSSSHPDHCLLLVANQFEPRHPTPFKFENLHNNVTQAVNPKR